MKTIKINNKNYIAKDFDFNMYCDFMDMGISFNSQNMLPIARAYVAVCMDADKVTAGKELEAHMMSYDNPTDALGEIAAVISEKLEESGFFRKLFKSKEAETAEN